MRVLVGNNALANPGGSETYTYSLVEALLRKGHEVECITPRVGIVARQLIQLGVPVHTAPIFGAFDLLLLSHRTSIAMAWHVKGYRVQTCHGVHVPLEQPVNGMNCYVAISEEVQDHLQKKGYTSVLIRNGVDCKRFSPKGKPNPILRRVLSLSHSDEVNRLLQMICPEVGIEIKVLNKMHNPIWKIEDLINEADLVISLGRGCYEAMACGRNVLVYDKRDYTQHPAMGDGLVTIDNITDFLKCNCSGRYSKKQFMRTTFFNEFSKYDAKHGEKLREFALEHLNIDKQVDKYLSLAG